MENFKSREFFVFVQLFAAKAIDWRTKGAVPRGGQSHTLCLLIAFPKHPTQWKIILIQQIKSKHHSALVPASRQTKLSFNSDTMSVLRVIFSKFSHFLKRHYSASIEFVPNPSPTFTCIKLRSALFKIEYILCHVVPLDKDVIFVVLFFLDFLSLLFQSKLMICWLKFWKILWPNELGFESADQLLIVVFSRWDFCVSFWFTKNCPKITF